MPPLVNSFGGFVGMKAKEKAKELVDKFGNVKDEIGFGDHITLSGYSQSLAKQCALIAVDEILKNGATLSFSNRGFNERIKDTPNMRYWQEVKQEIERL